ncbi:hypothetical protein [Frankia torreyi]|nr:hypothetical protein [Frankia torreyi]
MSDPAPAGTGAGQRAFFDDPPTGGGAPSTVHDSDTGTRWDETHQRRTVWLPRELVEAIVAAAAATGQSQASLVQEALRAHPAIAAELAGGRS